MSIFHVTFKISCNVLYRQGWTQHKHTIIDHNQSLNLFWEHLSFSILCSIIVYFLLKGHCFREQLHFPCFMDCECLLYICIIYYLKYTILKWSFCCYSSSALYFVTYLAGFHDIYTERNTAILPTIFSHGRQKKELDVLSEHLRYFIPTVEKVIETQRWANGSN